MASNSKRSNRAIWIDLDNSPHVPFFVPIMRELKKAGYDLLLTARDCSQTCGMADLYGLEYHRIGRHYGKKKLMKVYGTIMRGLQLVSAVRNKGIKIAVSHGSRAQMLASHLLGITSVAIMDYEYTKGFVKPDWVIIPEIIPVGSIRINRNHIFTYPGIKEDVYVPDFIPTQNLRRDLGLKEKDILVTIRPPAIEAHYHNPQSEVLFNAVIEHLTKHPAPKMVLLPRYDRQREIISKKWEPLTRGKKIIVLDKVVNGLDLIWHSDLVVSGGGTMNREAASLGVPVYSIFRGKIGAVDHYLSENGRLVLIENEEDIYNKIQLIQRDKSINNVRNNNEALKTIISHFINIIGK